MARAPRGETPGQLSLDDCLETIVLPDTPDAETGKPIKTSRMVFVEKAEDVDRADVLAPSERERGGKTGEAEAWLEAALGDGDWHDSTGLKRLAPQFSERTFQRAAKDIKVETDRRGFPSSTWWRLPQSRHPSTTRRGATAEVVQQSQTNGAGRPVAPASVGDATGGATWPSLDDPAT